MALTPTQLQDIERAKAMVIQTQAEGSTPFAGSSFDTSITSATLAPAPTSNFQSPSNPPTYSVPEVTPPATLTPEQQKAQGLSEQIQGLTSSLLGESADKTEQVKATGLTELQKTQDDLYAQIQNFQLKAQDLENQKGLAGERIQQESIGRGRTSGGVAPLTAAEQRRITLQQADNYSQSLTATALYNATQGKITTAQRQVEDAISAKYGPAKEQIAVASANLDSIINSPKYSAEQKAQAQAQKEIQDAKALALEKQETNEKAVMEIALKVASLGKIDSVTLDKIRKETDPVVAMQLAAPFLEQDKSDVQVLGSASTGYFTYDPSTGETKPISGGGGGKQVSTSSDPFVQLLMDSSGGKPLTDTSIQSLTKGINVLGQLGVLQTNIQNTNTGPITGAFRGTNPWDTNAQTIKAQLNAIVPNLARGIYGEVGVLTDNDIATYAKTLPNLTSTEAVRNAVLGITLDLIGKSIKNTLSVNAAAGRDVSGFVDLYTEMINNRDSIFAQIPGYKGAGAVGTQSLSSLGITKDEESLFDTTVSGSTTPTSGGIGGFFSNLWKGLTGQ